MRTTAEIVSYLTRHYLAESEEVAENVLPEKIDDLVHKMGEFLQTRLEEDTPHQAIWDSFRRDPYDNAASLIGILEALFEAQPGVKARVDGYMQGVTAIEAKSSDHELSLKGIEESLKNDPNGLITRQSDEISDLANQPAEKNPPAYLYDNEQAGFESDRKAPVSEPFMVGENAQIIYVPTQKTQFPTMFNHLLRLTEISEDLNNQEKQIVEHNLELIRNQLTGEKPFDAIGIANAIQDIWEVAPSYANALIESLQQNINELPIDARDFIIQLHSPLH